MPRDIADRDDQDDAAPPGGCILVVEDDAMLRRVVVRTLQSWGFEIDEAPDGGVAIEKACLDDANYCVILLDIWLPVMNGVEVARRIRLARPDQPIVACSAALDEKVRADLRETGVIHLLPKPYSADSLLTMLRLAVAG